MELLKKYLVVKKSKLPDAGKGLFTKIIIPKGTLIVEYKGEITTWKEVESFAGRNDHAFFVQPDYVIDAGRKMDALARYANDARGINKLKGLVNNSEFVKIGRRIFIKSVSHIAAGAEILVYYGKEYWKVVRYNIKFEKVK
jgi:uncharacterized protein